MGVIGEDCKTKCFAQDIIQQSNNYASVPDNLWQQKSILQATESHTGLRNVNPMGGDSFLLLFNQVLKVKGI